MIIISKTHFSEIRDHSVAAFPYECCGAIFGVVENDKKIVVELLPIENRSTEDQRKRFSITDNDYLNMEDYAKDKELSLLGFYHSHPNEDAQPSDTDLKYAWPFFSYLIQSVYDGVPRELNSFELDPSTLDFSDEKLILGSS